MARVSNTTCDGCGKILLGQDKLATISETFMSIVGSVSLQTKEAPETNNKRAYTFFTETHRDFLSFCDVKCFVEWMKLREAVMKNRREKSLRKEVEN